MGTVKEDTVDVTLYQIPPSFCSQKVRLTLAEKGVPHEQKTVNIGLSMENYEPWYVRLNPAAVVPTLVHGDTVVTDSARIVRHVDAHMAGPALMPEDPERRAQAEALIDAVDALSIRTLSYGSLRAPKRALHGAIGLRLRRLRRLARENPELAEAYRAKIADVEGWQHAVVTPAETRAARAQTVALLDDIEARLGDGRAYLTGETYTLADTLATVLAARLVAIGLGDEVATRPHLHAWYEQMKERPSFEAAEIMERIRPATVARIAAPFVLPRLAAVAAIAAGAWLVLTWM